MGVLWPSSYRRAFSLASGLFRKSVFRFSRSKTRTLPNVYTLYTQAILVLYQGAWTTTFSWFSNIHNIRYMHTALDPYGAEDRTAEAFTAETPSTR